MKKGTLYIYGITAAALIFVMTIISCDNGTTSNGTAPRSTIWDGVYFEDEYEDNPVDYSGKAVLNIVEKTLTVTDCGSKNFYTNFVLTDVNVGETKLTEWNDYLVNEVKHSVTWSYIYDGKTKVGVVYKWSTNWNGYIDTYYYLETGSKWTIAFAMVEDVDGPDLSDVELKNRFTGKK